MNRIYWGCIFGFFSVLGLANQAIANEMMYRPLGIRSGQEINQRLSDQDIPTGEGGFARDYVITLQEGDQVAIDLLSDDFDTIVLLLAADGSTIAENDDAADGSTNSLLFVRINETGRYIVRVRAFGETGNGDFSLKVTRLQPIRE
ncbi:PPC domain-containing protein [Picosynechococcus sp. PCC 7117]|uniref:PPC domain-containing protein n=1 Tax=Picosynechococcus sp. PCC 7117 TaxID=195498 RepID=UPI0008103739|nr:peptidase [Picosynechococcus sp. PCC 7117]